MVIAEPLAPEDVAALAAELAQGASPAFRLVLADELRASAERLGRWRFTDPADVRVQTAIFASMRALAEAVELWTERTPS